MKIRIDTDSLLKNVVYICKMRYFVFLCLFFLTAQLLFAQTVYEKILIPVFLVHRNCTIYNDSALNGEVDKEVKKIAKMTKCEDYLVADAFPYRDDDDCTDGIKELFRAVVKDSIRWVKIDFNELGGLSFTLTTRSFNLAKPITALNKPEVVGNHLFSLTVLPLCGKDKSQFSERDSNLYLQLTVKADQRQTKNLLFQTFKEAIYFREESIQGKSCKFFTNPLLKDEQANEIIKRMAENVKLVGKVMKEQNDSQNQTITADCKYKGKMLFDAMQMTTTDDIKMFLSYCTLRPDAYRRNTWSISEVYATWLVAGMPLPKK